MTIGEEIKRLRKEKGLKMRELERATGVSQPYLSQIESTARNPSPEVLAKIAPVLKISKLHLYKVAGYLDETDILSLIDENKRLREALAFYEKVSNYEPWRDEDQDRSDAFNLIDLDQGETARKALEGSSNDDRTNL